MKKKKYAIILICLLVIAIAIIAINIRIPKRISINQNISELSVTRGKDGVIQKIGDCDKIAGMINGIHVRTYSVVSILKGDASRTGWEYYLSYKDSDGKHKSIVISQSNIKYNGKSYTVEDTDMITDIINELAAVYSEYDSKIIKFNLTDLKNIIIKSNITSKKVTIDGKTLDDCIERLSKDNMPEKAKPDIERTLYKITLNYNDGTSEEILVYFGDVLMYKGKYYEPCRNLCEVINEHVGD